MQPRWIDRAIRCCGGPIFFYSDLYLLLGALFITGSLFLDPDMAPVGIILLLVGLGILLLSAGVFPLAAQRSREKASLSDHWCIALLNGLWSWPGFPTSVAGFTESRCQAPHALQRACR